MAVKIYISGNFLIAEDAVSREQFFKVKSSLVYHLRDPDDIFAFFNEGTAPKTEGSPQTFQLGVQNSWTWNSPDLVQTAQTNFEFAEILDGDSLPYASADILDQYFNDNLGSCSSATVIVNGKHSELILDDGTNPHGTTQSDVGLSNVDNTSDIDKPISTLTQTALDGKVESVTGLNTDNTDPINPIVKVSVDGVTVTGQGTPADPLVSIGGGSTNIYNSDGSVNADRTVDGGAILLTFGSGVVMSFELFQKMVYSVQPETLQKGYQFDIYASFMNGTDILWSFEDVGNNGQSRVEFDKSGKLRIRNSGGDEYQLPSGTGNIQPGEFSVYVTDSGTPSIGSFQPMGFLANELAPFLTAPWRPNSIPLGSVILNGAILFTNAGAGVYLSLAGNADPSFDFNDSLNKSGSLYPGSDLFLRMHCRLSSNGGPGDNVKLNLSSAIVKPGDNSETTVTTHPEKTIDVSNELENIQFNIDMDTITGVTNGETIMITNERNSSGTGQDTYNGALEIIGLEWIVI